MDKRYQVFVSSTYEDLQAERQEVMHALLELDCIPAGMELFPAADEEQWSLIKKVIDDCDYYIVIIGGRYGSVGPDGISYTEMEYRYALEKEKPIIAFLHKDPDTLIAKKTEKKPESQKLLVEFRKLAEQKMCKYWLNSQELGSVVSRSLIKLIKTNPAVGWVKADILPDIETTKELLELRKKVDELETDLERINSGPPKDTEDLSQGEDKVTIHYTVDYDRSRILNFNVSWNEIFARISPLMINEARESKIQESLKNFIEDKDHEMISQLSSFPLGIDKVRITDEDFHTILVQLRALGLISKSSKQRSIKDLANYWTLTPYGDNLLTKLRAIKKPPRVVVRQKGAKR